MGVVFCPSGWDSAPFGWLLCVPLSSVGWQAEGTDGDRSQASLGALRTQPPAEPC